MMPVEISILQYRFNKCGISMQVGRLKDAGSRIVKSFWWWGDDGDDDYLEDIAEQVRLRVDACPGAPSSAGVKHEE